MSAYCLYWILCMQTLVLTLGQLAIKTNCHVLGSPCTISCSIPDFSKLASWSRNNTSMTSCTNRPFCDIGSTGIYNFSANQLGIYVAISDLTSNENGVKWTCTHGEDTPVSLSISILEKDEMEKSGLAGGAIAGIVIGVIVVVIVIIVIVICVLR
ncbi:uncharacterized protein [Mytilus edulis]|uniref:uncharacterized protein n=1 Tax=Mytilus edulis TaxID=6550 RepID=UPI0039EE8488